MKYDLDLIEGKVCIDIDIPQGTQRLLVLASKLLELSSVASEMGSDIVRDMGKEISCTKGCGSCCRQLVPLSPLEAGIIYEIVESMPDNKKSEVKERFACAHQILEDSGLLEVLNKATLAGDQNQGDIARDYFNLGIACPFLEEDSCIIHPVRPSRCREYLVISPPENCAVPYKHEVKRVPISIKLSQAFTGAWCSLTGNEYKMIPHILSLDWINDNERLLFAAVDSKSFVDSIIGYINFKTEKARKAEQSFT